MCQFCGSNEAENEQPAAAVTTDSGCVACGEESALIEGVDSREYCGTCHSENFAICDNCNDEVRRDDTSSIANQTVCNTCESNEFTVCDSCGNTHHNDEIRQHDFDDWCDDCFHDAHSECEGCGDMFHRGRLNWSDDVCYCNDCYEECSGCKGKRFSRSSDLCEQVGSLRTFGVELETHECPDFTTLSNKTYFTSKYDGSISGEEFVTGILSGDEGLDAVSDFCDAADDLGFQIDRQCGYHVHIGVGDLSEDQRKAVAKAYVYTQQVWQSFVSESRRRNQYCCPLRWSADDIDTCRDFDWFCNDQDRYQWFNLSAWGKHNTFEVRLHGASLNARKINNWVIAHIRFIEYVANYGSHELKNKTPAEQFEVLCRIWGMSRLSRYYQRRAEKFGTTYTVPQDAPAVTVETEETLCVA